MMKRAFLNVSLSLLAVLAIPGACAAQADWTIHEPTEDQAYGTSEVDTNGYGPGSSTEELFQFRRNATTKTYEDTDLQRWMRIRSPA